MKISIKDYRVPPKEKVRLKKWPTRVKAVYKSKEHYEILLREQQNVLGELQNLLYASDRHALLLIFQAMDAEVMHD